MPGEATGASQAIWWRKALGAALIAVALAAAVWAGRAALLHRFYPFAYRDEIVAEANKNGLDPLFVASIIRSESRFNPSAVSPQGAIGLMQIMPETGRWAADRLGLDAFEPSRLHEPALNIRIGTWYLAELRREFKGKLVLVVAAYNAGRTRAREWAEADGVDLGSGAPEPGAGDGPWPGQEIDEDFPLASIPLAETRGYVREVLAALRRYRQLYVAERPGGDW